MQLLKGCNHHHSFSLQFLSCEGPNLPSLVQLIIHGRSSAVSRAGEPFSAAQALAALAELTVSLLWRQAQLQTGDGADSLCLAQMTNDFKLQTSL